MKRLSAMLLALALVLSMLPVTALQAFAEENLTLEEIIEETIPEETLPEETAPEETIPEETIPEETLPEETIPEETLPEETLPEEILPEETIPEESFPEETIPEEIIPEETIPEDVVIRPVMRDEPGTTVDADAFVKAEDAEYLSLESSAQAIQKELLDRNTEFSIYAYMAYDETATEEDLLVIGDSLIYAALACDGGANAWDYLMCHFTDYECALTYGNDGENFYFNIQYQAYYLTTAEQEAKVDSKVKSILKELDLGKASDYKKINGIYKYLINNVNYNDTVTDETDLIKYSAYGALVNKKANSHGFAVAFYRLARELGLYSNVFYGYVGDSEEYDAWNIVYLDGYYYYVDAAQDAIRNDAGKSKAYFLKGTTTITDHTPDEAYKEAYGPYCSPIDYIDGAVVIGQCGENVYFTLSTDNTLHIVGEGDMYNYASGNANPINKYVDYIGAIEIEKGVTSIGDYAFYQCFYISKISIPSSVTKIGNYAFKYCTHMKTATVPSSVLSIGDNAFEGCYLLQKISLSSGLQSIGTYAFYKCEVLPSITLPKTLLSIGDYAFTNCPKLKSITIPSSVTSMGKSAFSSCDRLTEVNIKAKITALPDRTFQYCDALKEVTLPDSLKTIGQYAFSQCKALEKITLPNGLQSIGSYAFGGCDKLKNIKIPDTVTTIANYAFDSCNSFTAITIPGSVTNLGSEAFEDCSNVEEVTFEEGITTIPSAMFQWYSSLEKVNLPDTLIEIGSFAFAECRALKSIVLPPNLEKIGSYAFCSSGLTSIVIPDSVTTIANHAFEQTSITTAVIGTGITEIPWGMFSSCWKLTDVTIPDTVTVIGPSAFSKCQSLERIDLPNGLTTLQRDVFADCTSLLAVKIPETVTSIESNIFNGCSSLKAVSLPATCVATFKDCKAMEHVFYAGTQESWGNTSSNIPSATVHCGVTEDDFTLQWVGSTCFCYCNICDIGIDIGPINVADCRLEMVSEAVYTGSSIRPAVKLISGGGKVLVEGTDYTVSYSNNKNIGKAKVTIKAKGELTGSRTETFSIVPPQVKNVRETSASNTTVKIAYNGVSSASKYEIYLNGEYTGSTTKRYYTLKNLTCGEEYQVTVVAVKTVSSKKYSSPASEAITIRPYQNISDYKVTMEYTSVIYDGETKLPAITVQKNTSSDPLVQDMDYTVTYEDNAQIGTATVTIAGINAYGGSITKTFDILPDQVQNLKVEIASGTSVNITFDPVLGATEYWIYRDGERVQKTKETSCTVTGLSAGKDNVFTVKAAAEAKGEDYTGAASEAVTAQPFFTVSLSQYEFAYTGKYQRPTVTVYGYNGEELTEGEDYTLSFKNNKNTGKAYVQVTGKGAYSGSVKEYYAINPAQVTGLKVSSTTKTSVKISFTKASSNSTKYYNVYVNGEKVGRTTSSSYTIKNLTLGEIYSVYVVGEKTVSGTAYYGEASEVIKVWPGTGIGGYTATLDFTKADYTGEAICPGVVVKTSTKKSAKTLVQGLDYIVTYENNVEPGKAKVIIQGKEGSGYTGTITKTLTINPPKVENVTATAASNTSIEVSFDAAPGATSYWVYVNGERKAKITDTTCVITGLKKNKTYKITVKAVATVDGTNYTSDYTDAVSCKTVIETAE